MGGVTRMVFGDDRIDAIRCGARMTAEEREFLLNDTPNFEECSHTKEALAAMGDADLMQTAYTVWADYCR